MARSIAKRGALEAPYLRPYRRWLPLAWRMTRTVPAVATGVASGAASGLAALLTGEPGWLAPGGLVLMATAGYGLYETALASLLIRERTRGWDRTGTLRSVREHRPHAVDIDPDLAHDEYAVTVEDSGELWVWRYRPLPVDELPIRTEVLVPGRPQWAAEVVEIFAFDRTDAGVAAEQLTGAQQRAALLEAEDRVAAHRLIDEAARAHELAVETESTAAALRHLTGQRDRSR